ncbi:hypothetical protein H8B09_10650 [Paenibacillus sp. PR3]|uniref:Uncharacterized protein n=1 Tax=Paenibacillus terricola TaxID=2763503 RepID=A0ABR8MTB7_9BACL|nr:hypothetical protein [Paenibacillus terricola]MBD3919212.1 hypothetical protein [Paenibacillus terricola]
MQLNQMSMQMEQLKQEKESLSDKISNSMINSNSVDQLAMKLSLLGAISHMKDGGEASVPLMNAFILANHLINYIYALMPNDEASTYTKSMDPYKDINQVKDPFLYLTLQEPISLTINTTTGKESVDTKEILLLVKDKKVPLLFVAGNNGFTGYSLLEGSTYDYNVLFGRFIEHREAIEELFRDW